MKTDAEWKKQLTEDQYRITRRSDTERPFCGTLLDNKREGVYACICCSLPLFSSAAKFNSGTGWPSFFQPIAKENVAEKRDDTHGMVRTEINCARCRSHLGHVFDDGPKPTGQRHCLNSASLKFYGQDQERPPESRPQAPPGATAGAAPGAGQAPPARSLQSRPAESKAAASTETAYFAGGCFWGLEHYFQEGPGVIEAVSGYMQGEVERPTYKQVCADTTGHAETVKVVFDPQRITYRRLLEAFFVMHDATQLNRQGPDFGKQYRSGIWFVNEDQERQAEAYIKELQATGPYQGRKIVTQLEPARTFWPAEEYHQDYVEKTGQSCHVKNPW
jgi:peptide methionine sulfoxide reductase msrA/msrB